MWHDPVLEFLGLDAPIQGLRIVAWAFLMYLSALVIVRVGKSRFIGRATPFDLIVAFMLGSTLSRGINGDAAFIPTVAAGFLIVGMHWLVAVVATRSRRFSALVKGETDILVEDGRVQWENMRRHRITEGDLMEAVRSVGRRQDVADVRLAMFERNGAISIVPRRRPTHAEAARPRPATTSRTSDPSR